MAKEGFVFIILLISFLACKTSKTTISLPTDSKTYLFPVEWIGIYEGQLNILGQEKGDTMKVDMELIIDQPDAMGLYPWVLKYNKEDVRYYGLEVKDAEKGHYLIDEYNSIKLDGFLRGNHFITRFKVMNSDLTFHYSKEAEGISIQVEVFSNEALSETGGEIIAQDTVPKVKSYLMTGYQTGFLKQIK